MMNTKYIFTLDELDAVLESEKQIIIYGAGGYGKRIADYIISVGKKYKIKCFWVTEKKGEDSYKGREILESGEESLAEHGSLIIVAVSRIFLHDILEIVQQYDLEYHCVTQELYDDVGGKLEPKLVLGKGVSYKGLDFLAAGFFKCGTSSLYRELMECDDIYVSKNKESLYFSWCDIVENPEEKLIREHFDNIQEGQLVGAVEPSFYRYAGRIKDLFGKQIKVLFLVRNPVDAAFSHFKMLSRNGDVSLLRNIYQKFGGVCCVEVFGEWIKEQRMADIFKYNRWIQQFMEYYPREQIKIVVFEEMVNSPRKVINDIMQFIGSSHEYVNEHMSWSNEGKFVMADVKGLEMAEKWSQLRFEYEHLNGMKGRSRNEIFNEYMEVEREYNQAERIYDLKLPKDMRRKLENYYGDSVRALEKIINKDLSGVWF